MASTFTDGFIAEDVPADEGDALRTQADRSNRRLDQMRRLEEGKSAEQMAAELNERYSRTRITQESDYTEVPQRMLMPSVEDPNIWNFEVRRIPKFRTLDLDDPTILNL